MAGRPPIKHYLVSVRLDAALQPLQVTITTIVDDEIVTYLTYDGGPFEAADEAFQNAMAALPEELRLW